MNPCYSCWANETVEYQLLFIHKINAQLQLDLNKHNDQYPPIEARTYKSSHDRFLIIDNTEVYHIGASLKDLGKKMFAFSKLELPAHTIIDVLWNKLITHARSGREYKIQDGNWRIGSHSTYCHPWFHQFEAPASMAETEWHRWFSLLFCTPGILPLGAIWLPRTPNI